MTTSVTPAVLQPGAQLTTSAVTYITGAANSQTIIKRAVFTNTGTVATTITAWRVVNLGSAGVTNEIIPVRPISANATDLAPELANMVLNSGDIIQCSAGTVSAVNFFASGFIAT